MIPNFYDLAGFYMLVRGSPEDIGTVIKGSCLINFFLNRMALDFLLKCFRKCQTRFSCMESICLLGNNERKFTFSYYWFTHVLQHYFFSISFACIRVTTWVFTHGTTFFGFRIYVFHNKFSISDGGQWREKM